MVKKTVKVPKLRLDELLVERGLAESIKVAQSLILAGEVIVNEQRAAKSGDRVREDASVRVKSEGRFVSRGGEKLLAAIEDFGLAQAFLSAIVIDVGASTGGFTDCCLQLGATHVFAVDVGTNQLAWKLRTDSRVTSVEKTDIRDFTPPDRVKIDWIVADISFNSVARIADDLARLGRGARMLLLIKPQFELPRDRIPPGGVVVEDDDRNDAYQAAAVALNSVGIEIVKRADSRIHGRSGNREIFVLARKTS